MNVFRAWHAGRAAILLAWAMLSPPPTHGEDAATVPAKLVAHWPLRHDARDTVGTAHGQPEQVSFSEGGAAFNGRDARIQVPADVAPKAGTDDFSLSVWVRCATPLTSTLGDLLSKFDPAARRGINLHVAGSSPAYSGMARGLAYWFT